jgi:hypothetical protein
MENLSKPVQDVVAGWPKPAQSHFHTLRAVVHDAAKLADIGVLTETLKWREPAWLPEKPGIGSTLRASWSPKHPDALGVFLNCNSTLPETIRSLYPTTFKFDGKRSIYLPLKSPLPTEALHHCAHLTLTYHRAKT